MKVIFIDSYKKEREIGEGNTKDECFSVIDKFLEDHKYESYYKRTWKADGGEMIDVGSWSEFFKII